MPANHSNSFFDHQLLIGSLARDVVDLARGPADDNGVYSAGRTNPEVQPGIAGGLEAAVGPHLGGLLQAAGFDF